ncbi:hypothetical protein HZ994_05410 [Akkermansiaceae bacterium]|nr:hypothetical protein HZ994_05410 [Akkermansiaceae bacterium]
MKAFLPLIASISTLAASPYGISIPPGTQQQLPVGTTAVRFSPADSDYGASAKPETFLPYGVLRPDSVPAKDEVWRGFVTETTEAIETGIRHWEVLDSFNLGARNENTPFRYIELLTIAKKAAPQAKIGFSLANYDLEFLDDALREGAGDQFDFISLSPFPCSEGIAPVLPTVLPTLRRLLALHGVDAEMPVHITLTGSQEALSEAAPLALSLGFAHVFLETDPATFAKIPTAPAAVPETADHSGKTAGSITFGQKNRYDGLHQLFPTDTPWDEELGANRLHLCADPPVFRTTFLTAAGLVPPDTSTLEITVTARRLPTKEGLGKPTAINLTYESTFGTNSPETWFSVPGENKWHTHTWKITDAKFTGKLGWNFLLDASGAGNDVLIREISVSR